MMGVSGWAWCPARSSLLRGKQEEGSEGLDGSVEILESSSSSSSGTIFSFLIYSSTRERCGAGQICHAHAIHSRHSAPQ